MFVRNTSFQSMLFFAFALAAAGAAQETSPPRDTVLTSLGDRASLFFEGLSRNQTAEAFRELLAGSALADREDAVKQLVAQTAQLAAKYGRYRGAEQIGSRRVGQDLVLLRYLGKYDQSPVVWTFAFYRPPPLAGAAPADPEPWRVVSVQFHTDLERLWERSP